MSVLTFHNPVLEHLRALLADGVTDRAELADELFMDESEVEDLLHELAATVSVADVAVHEPRQVPDEDEPEHEHEHEPYSYVPSPIDNETAPPSVPTRDEPVEYDPATHMLLPGGVVVPRAIEPVHATDEYISEGVVSGLPIETRALLLFRAGVTDPFWHEDALGVQPQRFGGPMLVANDGEPLPGNPMHQRFIRTACTWPTPDVMEWDTNEDLIAAYAAMICDEVGIIDMTDRSAVESQYGVMYGVTFRDPITAALARSAVQVATNEAARAVDEAERLVEKLKPNAALRARLTADIEAARADEDPAKSHEVLAMVRGLDEANVGHASLSDRFLTNGSITTADLFEFDDDESVYALYPLVGYAQVVNVVAQPKAGKSFNVFLLCMRAAAGLTVCGKSYAERPLRVLYLDWEMSKRDVRERTTQFGFNEDTSPIGSTLFYVRVDHTLAANTAEGGATILEMARTVKADLVVIDTLSKAAVGSNKEAATANDMDRFCTTPLRQEGLGVIVIDHTNHTDTTRPGGSIMKLAGVDGTYAMSRKGNLVTFKSALPLRQSWALQQFTIRTVESDGMLDAVVESAQTTSPKVPKKISITQRLYDAIKAENKAGRMPSGKTLIEMFDGDAGRDQIRLRVREMLDRGFVVNLGTTNAPKYKVDDTIDPIAVTEWMLGGDE